MSNDQLQSLATDSIQMIRFFVDFFDAYANGQKDDRDIEFDGEGAYFGKQISIREGSGVGFGFNATAVEVEVAYDFVSKSIVIYTDNHNGFWVPPFLSIKDMHSEWEVLSKALFRMLTRYFGVNV